MAHFFEAPEQRSKKHFSSKKAYKNTPGGFLVFQNCGKIVVAMREICKWPAGKWDERSETEIRKRIALGPTARPLPVRACSSPGHVFCDATGEAIGASALNLRKSLISSADLRKSLISKKVSDSFR
jgi:hypothetical protein